MLIMLRNDKVSELQAMFAPGSLCSIFISFIPGLVDMWHSLLRVVSTVTIIAHGE